MSYIERIRGPQQATVVPINGTRREPGEGIHPYAAAIRQAWLDRLDNLASRPWQQGDAWDTNCFVTARKLIELANSSWAGYSHADARADYLAHAPRDSKWDQREKCWQQAEKKAAAVMLPEPEARDTWDVPDVTVLEDEVRAAIEADADPLARFNLIDWPALKREEEAGEDWLAEPLIAAGRMTALYSAPKAGKSLLVLEIVAAIALGQPVLGQPAADPIKVLYVDFENDPRGDIKPRLEDMGHDLDDLADKLFVSTFPSMAHLDTPLGGEELRWLAEHLGVGLVVIDTVSRTVGGEENDNNTWLNFYRSTGIRLKRDGVACLRLDHSGKDVERGMRGGSAKYGDVDAVWRLTATSASVLELVCTDHRMPVLEDRMTLVRDTEPVLRHRVASDRTVAVDARDHEIEALLDHLNIPVQASGKECLRRLQAAGEGRNKQAVLRVARARRLRLEEPSQGGSGTPSEPPGTPQGGRGSRGPLRSRSAEPPLAGGSREPEPADLPPMFVVACKSCFSPTDRDVAHTNAGLCPKCAAAAGTTTPGGEPA